MCHIGTKRPKFKTYHLLYGFVTQRLGTTKFTNLLAEINNENGLDFPIQTSSGEVVNKMQDH